MQPLRSARLAPLEGWKNLRRIADRFRLAVHVMDEVAPDVGHRLDAVTLFLHARVTAIPAEADEKDSTFDADAGVAQIVAGELHRGARGDGIVEQNGGLVRVDRS